MTDRFTSKCTATDYEDWLIKDTSGNDCVMGRKARLSFNFSPEFILTKITDQISPEEVGINLL
jgi:hypothetical protein